MTFPQPAFGQAGQTLFDQSPADSPAAFAGGNRQMVNVTAPAIMPAQNSPDQLVTVHCHKA